MPEKCFRVLSHREFQKEGAAQRKLQRTKSVDVMVGIKVDSERELRTQYVDSLVLFG